MTPQRLDRTISGPELRRLATLHRNAIEGGFLSSLGERFLVSLYRTICRSDHAAVWALWEGERLLGFIVGSTSTRAIYREFAWTAGPAALAVVLPKLVSLRVARRLLETALYPSRRERHDEPVAEVLNFCVDSGTRGRGVGQALFAALAGDFRGRGVESLRIVTGSEQRSAQRFYEAAGAELVGETEVHRGEPSLVYRYSLRPEPHAAVA